MPLIELLEGIEVVEEEVAIGGMMPQGKRNKSSLEFEMDWVN